MSCLYEDSYSQLTQEQEMIMQLVNFRNPDIEGICTLKNDCLDWAEIMGHLAYNRVAGIAHEVIMECITKAEAVFNREFRFGLYLIQEMQKIRTLANKKVLFEVAEKLYESGLPHAFLKGSILANSIYPEGCRISNDIDILLNSADLTRCGNILREMGFTQGFFDRSKNEIRPATRKEVVQYRMNYGEIVPFLKKIDEPGLNLIEIDINFSLDWAAQGTEKVVAAFLSETADYKLDSQHSIRSLSYEYFLAHLCVHLYKEAYVMDWVKGQRDLSLYKFVDIYGFITDTNIKISWEKFIDVTKRFNIYKECYYALEYTRTFFPVLNTDSGFVDMINKIRPEDTGYLNEIVDAKNPDIKYVWKRDLMTRFFDMKRLNSLEKL